MRWTTIDSLTRTSWNVEMKGQERQCVAVRRKQTENSVAPELGELL
jgi:hypothetical protein